jgi:glucan endo-1,3-alpha-glucosidase
VKPDFVEFLTWNDGCESSYIGNVWPDAITGSPAHTYIDNFDHSGWGQLIAPFITAYKAGKSNVADIVPPNGAEAAGVFWHRTILTTATCASDPIGKPGGWNNAEDVVNVAVILSGAAAGSTVNVYSGGSRVGSMIGVKGLNAWSVSGLKVGAVKVEVLPKSGGSTLLSKTGKTNVAADAAVCNYNYQVVGLN